MAVKITCSKCGKPLWEGLTNPEDPDDFMYKSKIKNTTLEECLKAICSDCILFNIIKGEMEESDLYKEDL